MVTDLFKIEARNRDAAWEKKFLAGLSEAALTVVSPDPQEGPDHWPYLFVSTDGVGDDNLRGIADWLSTRGIGLAINPTKPTPDYVMTYGMIWNYRERGEFVTELPEAKSGNFQISPGQKLWTGVPSEAYLPRYVRSVLKQFLNDQGVFAPKVLMVNFAAGDDQPKDQLRGYDLCFSIESLKSPPAHEHANIAEALGWFLPTHYSVSLISEKTVPGFVAL